METIVIEDSTTEEDIEKGEIVVVEIDKVEYSQNYYSSILVAKAE